MAAPIFIPSDCTLSSIWGFPGGSEGKEYAAIQETQVQSLVWEDPLEKGMATYSSILPGEFHGQRSLSDYSPWGCKELGTTEQLKYTQTFQ